MLLSCSLVLYSYFAAWARSQASKYLRRIHLADATDEVGYALCGFFAGLFEQIGEFFVWLVGVEGVKQLVFLVGIALNEYTCLLAHATHGEDAPVVLRSDVYQTLHIVEARVTDAVVEHGDLVENLCVRCRHFEELRQCDVGLVCLAESIQHGERSCLLDCDSKVELFFTLQWVLL